MTEKEAIDILIAHATCCYGELCCMDYCPFYYDNKMHCDEWTDGKIVEAVRFLKGMNVENGK